MLSLYETDSKHLKSAVGIRGDCLYCPLCFSIDAYWNCETKCHHCYFRKLNRTWGEDLRPANPEEIKKKLKNGLRNNTPKSSLAWALKLKKTLRLGNKSDPFQDAEKQYQISRQILRILIDLEWSFVIQTRFLGNLMECEKLLEEAHDKGLLTVMPIISPGGEKDWRELERQRTTPLPKRWRIIERWIRKGWNVGVNGEPFIPGVHTEKDFLETIKKLKSVGVKSYNTYNLHFNDLVAKNLNDIGYDIEKIWRMNQDREWKKIHQRLCEIAVQQKIILGCPDFVNTGADWKEKANTCCGVNVPNPSLFNSHHWKRMLQDGEGLETILKDTWEGIGEKEKGVQIISGHPCDFYTMKDAGVIK